MNDDDLSSMVEIVDALFRILAEEAAGREGVTFEEAHEGTWALFEHGSIRISVCERAIERYAAMALMKRSPKMTAN